jgi:hypothetical protein
VAVAELAFDETEVDEAGVALEGAELELAGHRADVEPGDLLWQGRLEGGRVHAGEG